MWGHVVSVRSESVVVENFGVGVGIASTPISAEKLFPLPVFVVNILVPDVGRCRTMSVVSYLSRAWSKMWGVAVGIASPSVSVQKLFLLPVLVAAILNFGWPLMSDHVVSAIYESGVVENVGQPLGPRRNIFPFKGYYYFPFWWLPF